MVKSIVFSNEEYDGLNPVEFGYEACRCSHRWGPGVRTYWLIHFVVSGRGYFKICDREYHLSSGEMFIIPPYVEVYYEADEKSPWNYIWIGFTASKLPATLPDVLNCPEAFRIFGEMKNCENMEKGISAFLTARLWDLFAILLKERDTRSDYVKKAVACIHSEYMKGITVSEIAKKLNLDRTYFSALFKRKTGIPPKQYLVDYRMSVAASLLLNQGYSVSVTACSVGYSDIFTFSKMFKNHYGVSPNDYVKSNKTKVKKELR